jgi:hypothetical protein
MNIEDLIIVDVPHADRIPTKDLSWKKGAFFPAEECDRQLLIGTLEDEEHIPEGIRSVAVRPKDSKAGTAVMIEKGPDAYRHLVNVAVGMLDKQLGEKETIEGIRSNWLHFTESGSAEDDEKQARKQKFGNIMQALFADSKAVRAKVFEDRVGGNYLRPVSSEPAVAARNMLDIKPVDRVLIIGEKDGISYNTLKAIDTAFRTQTAAEAQIGGIVVTHPDPAEYEKLVAGITAMKKEKKLKGAVTCMPYEDAMDQMFPGANFVFNCQPMDNGVADSEMIERVRNRTNETATFINLKGVPIDRNRTSAAWNDAGIDRVLFVEDMQRQASLDRTHNERMRVLAERAIENCLASRMLGRQPVRDRLLMDPADYKKFVSQAGPRPRPNAPRSPIDHAERPSDPPALQ